MPAVMRDFSLSSVVAGFVAVLVGFTCSVAIVFAAGQALGATPAQVTSWIWALGLGMGLTTIVLTLASRQPVLTAWSTPGAAVIAASSGLTMGEAVGAFVLCGALIVASGVTRGFERVMDRIPQAIAAALLAGVLARYGLDAVGAVATAPSLVLAMTTACLVGRRVWPRYTVPGVLAVGTAVAAAQGRLQPGALSFDRAVPAWTTPTFSLAAFVGLALPLFIVTMASQNLPGVAAQRAAGGFYGAVGLAGGAVAGLLQAFPRELVLAVAGLALLGTIAGGLGTALRDETHRDAAVLTLLVTLSGLSVAGIGSAFWGVVAGVVALVVQQWRRARTA
jgi:benzoate membrane transport protein